MIILVTVTPFSQSMAYHMLSAACAKYRLIVQQSGQLQHPANKRNTLFLQPPRTGLIAMGYFLVEKFEER